MATKRQVELWDRVELAVEECSLRDAMLDALEPYYFLDGEKDQKGKKEEERIEVVHGPHGTNTIDLIQDMLAGAEMTVTVPARSSTKGDKRLADESEGFLVALLEEMERASGEEILAEAAWLVGMRGCLAGRVLFMEDRLEKGDEGLEQGKRSAIELQIRDPRFVYPSWDAEGLAYVVERWKRTVGDVRRTWGEKLLPKKKEDDEVEWTEYWDGEEFMYWVDDEPLGVTQGGRRKAGPWKHRYGGMPWVFGFARKSGRREPEKQVRPLLEGLRATIDGMDLLASMGMTHLKGYIGDALLVETERAEFKLDLKPFAQNPLEPGDDVRWLRADKQPAEMEREWGRLDGEFQRGTFPNSLFGMDPGRVMSGYSLNVLNQGGRLRLRPIVQCVERVLGGMLGRALMVAEMRLAPAVGGQVRVYQFVDEEAHQSGTGGTKRRVRRGVKLDAGKLDGYWEVEVSLGDLLPADEQTNLGLFAQSQQPGAEGRPLLSWETGVEKFNIVTSPDEERRRIDRQVAMGDPEVMGLWRRIVVAGVMEELEAEAKEKGVEVEEEEAPPLSPPLGQGGGKRGREEGIPEEEQMRRFMGGEERGRVESGEVSPAEFGEYEMEMLKKLGIG